MERVHRILGVPGACSLVEASENLIRKNILLKSYMKAVKTLPTLLAVKG
jgi:hypothetical protein